MSWVNDLATLRASTTYQVEVAVIMNGGIGSYGASCDVTTPPVQTTSLRPSQCGRIVTSPNSSILITPVAGALSYNVELTNTTLGYSQVINTGSSLAYFRFRNFTGITNGATYNVRIAAVTDAGTSDFGTTCAVMANFKTKLSAIYCDTVLTQLNSKLTCNGVVGTTKYHFRVFGPGGYDQTWISTNNSNTFRMTYVHALSPLSPGTAYNVTVKVEMNGGIGPYGDTCVVTTPAIFRLEEDAIETEELNFRAYPNPFRGNLVLELDNTAEVWVRDMTGRIVFHQEKAQGELQIGNELPQGFYLLSVQEGDLRKDLKIIKE
ncbi:MAG: T9SS type A sorting domain-containing protein [Bacteroidia bacterium]|nr:T9SS type A sorting domain-containing protein [Bacteroidia bacterium]